MIEKVVSGGQTGVDRAALDAASQAGVPCGGWCPKGRRAEDGPIDPRYPLKETPSEEYAQRTEWNVRDSDGSLIVTKGGPTGGTLYTVQHARQLGKPHLVIDLTQSADPAAVHQWLSRHSIKILNVAGPRETTCPGIYTEARAFLQTLLPF